MWFKIFDTIREVDIIDIRSPTVLDPCIIYELLWNNLLIYLFESSPDDQEMD